MDNQNKRYIEEDEIDLRELFLKIWEKKLFIAVFTFIVTVGSIVFAYSKTPIYEAKALIELGHYKLHTNTNNNNKVLIDNAKQLVKKLDLLFISMEKNNTNKEVSIVNISVPKGQTTFIEITSHSIDNKFAINKIDDVLKYINKEHHNVLLEVKQRRELEINNLNRKIEMIKNQEVTHLNEKILFQQNAIEKYKIELIEINKNLKKIENSNPTLAALRLIEKRDTSNYILTSITNLMDLKIKRDLLITTKLAQIEEKKELLKSLLLPHNYKNTQLVGKILTNDYPIKTKKKLIVIVSFVTALILSIFIIFFLNFLSSFRDQKKDKNQTKK